MKEKQNLIRGVNPAILFATAFFILCAFVSCEENIDEIPDVSFLPEIILSEEISV